MKYLPALIITGTILIISGTVIAIILSAGSNLFFTSDRFAKEFASDPRTHLTFISCQRFDNNGDSYKSCNFATSNGSIVTLNCNYGLFHEIFGGTCSNNLQYRAPGLFSTPQ